MNKTDKKNQVIELARQKGVIQAKDLLEAGLGREYLNRLTKQGLLTVQVMVYIGYLRLT